MTMHPVGVANVRIVFFWQKPIDTPLAHEFHFGQYAIGEQSVRFDNWDEQGFVRYTKNTHTFPTIIGSQYATIPESKLSLLRRIAKIKAREVQFVQFFNTAWSLRGENLFDSYVTCVERMIRCEPQMESAIREKYPIDPGYAYDFYLERDTCSGTPAERYWEIVAKGAHYLPVAKIATKSYSVPDDALILQASPFDSMGSRFKSDDLKACRFSWEEAGKAEKSVLLISPSLLDEYGLARVRSCTYMCSPQVFDLFEKDLDNRFWDFRVLTPAMISR